MVNLELTLLLLLSQGSVYCISFVFTHFSGRRGSLIWYFILDVNESMLPSISCVVGWEAEVELDPRHPDPRYSHPKQQHNPCVQYVHDTLSDMERMTNKCSRIEYFIFDKADNSC